MIVADITFSVLLGIPVTATVLYPAAMAVRSLFSADQLEAPCVPDSALPPLTLVISALNEENSIASRIENALSLSYPKGRLTILVISDGSTDHTGEIVRGFAGRGVQLVEYATNRGKSVALSDALHLIKTEVAVFTDANSHFEQDALRRLGRWFADQRVGAVCGRLVYEDSDQGAIGAEENRYWRWDNWIKNAESATGHMVAGNGSILAIRMRLAERIPGYLANDFAWLNIARLRGYRVCFDRTAVAFEKTAESLRGEFRRRVRIINRGLNAIVHAATAAAQYSPSERAPIGEVAFFFAQLIAKKLFRYLAFPAFLMALLMVPFLTPGVMFGSGLTLATLFLMAVTIGVLQPVCSKLTSRWPNTLYPLALASASFVALGRFVRRQTISTWQPHRATAPINMVPSASSTINDPTTAAA